MDQELVAPASLVLVVWSILKGADIVQAREWSSHTQIEILTDKVHHCMISQIEAIMAALINQLKEPISKLLKKGVETFKSLAEDMKKAVQLKEYADQMAHVTQVLKAVNEHLDDKERKVARIISGSEIWKL